MDNRIKVVDSYMGSGKILKHAIKKHGVENFTKDVLAVFETPEEMYQMESIVVDAEFVRRADTYNIKQGGNGGWDHINTNVDLSKRAKLLNEFPNKRFSGRQHTDETKRKIAYANSIRVVTEETRKKLSKERKGKPLTQAHKDKIGVRNSELQGGNRNSQYGTCWVYNEAGNKKIKKDDLQQYLDAGYVKGRSGKLFSAKV